MDHPSELRLVRAGPPEIRRLVSLLPAAARQPSQSEFFAAVRDGRLLGGAAFFRMHPPSNQARFQLALEDDCPEEASEMIVQGMKALARREGASELAMTGSVMEASAEEGLLLRCHFRRRGQAIEHFSINPKGDRWERFFRVQAQLEARGRIPPEARVLPLNQISSAAAGELLKQSIGAAGPEVHSEILNPTTASIGIRIGPSLKGLHVVHVQDGQASTSHLAVETDARGSWIFTTLIARVVAQLREMGIEEWSFKTNPGIHIALKNAAARMGADFVGRAHKLVFEIR